MSNHILETSYRGAQLKLDISDDGKAQLLINGLVRDNGSNDTTVRLSSVVQTDYEWHEFIEGIVSFEPGSITASLFANNTNLVRQTYKVSGK